MATWNIDRKKGGTYSFKLDAQGNYGLHKDGFEGVKTLNLPELKKEDTKPITTQDTKKASDQTQKAFGDVQPFYYRGGGADSNEQYIDEYKIKKDKSLDTDINQTYFRPNMLDVSGPVKEPVSDKFAQSIGPQKVNIPTEKKQISRVNVDQVLNERAQKEPVSDKFKYARGPQQVNVPVDKTFRTETQKFKERYRPTEIKAAPKKQTLTQTTLKNVTTGLKPLANAIGFVMNPVMGIGRMIAGSISPEQRNLNERNSSALGALGYKTRGELGSNIDSGRIAGNPADNVFAGMNAQSMTGNVFNGARSRISKREKTSKNLTGEKKERFDKKTQEFKDQLSEAQGEKNKQDIEKGPGHYGPAARHSGDGGGGNGGGKSIICTQMYQQTQLEDWKKTMQLWYIFQKKYLTIEHQRGYHFLFKPFVSGMKKSKILTAIGKHCAIARTNDIKHIMFGTPFSLLGRLVRLVTEPVCYITGKIKSWL